jgi:predicted Rossmann-fold nucleotide-binding protein
MDEYFESLVLIQTLKQVSFPVILMGNGFWKGLIDWMRHQMLDECGYISPEDMDVFTLVDEPEEAVKIIQEFKKSPRRSGLELPTGMKKI